MAEANLSQRELRRYRKQIMIPDIGIEGQEKLKQASVIVIGAGGLGCPVLQYLVAAGIGKIAIVDFDIVDEANLQRQILYGSDDLGKLKAIIAKNRLTKLNPMVEIEVINLRLDQSNTIRILQDYNVVVDATDNLETRYVINDSCVILGKPMVHGAIFKYEGEFSVFNYKGGPTYRCFNPFTGNREFKNPVSAEVGLFGVLPGITGTFMANEVIKIITGAGDVLSGKVVVFNILQNSFYSVTVMNNPDNHIINKIGDFPGT